MKLLLTLVSFILSICCFATGQQTFGTTTLRSPFLNMNKCYTTTGSATINPQGVINPTGTIIQWGTGMNLVTANTITITNPIANSYDTILYVKVSYSSYILLDTVKLSFVSPTMIAEFVNNSDICVEYPNNTYLDLSCTVTGLGNTSFQPYWNTASNYCMPVGGNYSNAGTSYDKTYWVFSPTANVATVTLKNSNGCVATTMDTFTFNLKQAGYSPFNSYDTLIKCGGVTTYTYANQPSQTNVSFAWGGVYANNGTTTIGLVTSETLTGTGYHEGSVIVTNNANGCVNTFSQVYNVVDLTTTMGGTHSLPCNGDSLTLIDGNYSPVYPNYTWSLTGNVNDYNTFIPGINSGNSYTLKIGSPVTVYSYHSGTITGETGTGTQTCVVLDTMVFVAGNPPAVTGITSTNTSGKTYSFVATGVANATTYSWDFGDSQTSSDVNPTHTYTATGSYTVKVTVSSSDASCGTAQTTYSLTVQDGGTGVNTVTPNTVNLKVYPNPAKDQLQIESTEIIKSIELITTMGIAIQLPLSNTINISHLPSGMYYLRVNKTYNYSIVKE